MSHSGRFKRTGKTGRWPIPKVASAAAESARAEAKPTGRIVHDERGNAVWNFGNDTTRTEASSSTILRRLDVPELQVEGQASAPAPARAKSSIQRQETPKQDEAGGYNPYDAPAKRPPPGRRR
jgi:hypothetical protein